MNDKKEYPFLRALTPIIITFIVCVAVVAIVAIIITFAWFDESNKHANHYNSQTEISSAVQGLSAEVDVKDLEDVKINWINGKIDVDYYDGNTIKFTESGNVSGSKMRYSVRGRTLSIMEYENMSSASTATFKEKNLSVKIPKNFIADEFSFESVSATITATALNASEVNFEAVSSSVTATALNTSKVNFKNVSGDLDVSFVSQPEKIDIKNVSGDAVLRFQTITGYDLKMNTVSGSFLNNADFNQGDGEVKIKFNSVSGDLILEKVNA